MVDNDKGITSTSSEILRRVSRWHTVTMCQVETVFGVEITSNIGNICKALN